MRFLSWFVVVVLSWCLFRDIILFSLLYAFVYFLEAHQIETTIGQKQLQRRKNTHTQTTDLRIDAM